MPKPPPVEYFMLRAPTPKELLGDAVAALTKLGLTEVNFDLMTDVPAFSRNRTTHEVGATDFLRPFVEQHPTFHIKEVSALFKADGRQPGAGYYAVRKLTEGGIIKKLDDDGNYTRSDVRQIAAPKLARDAFEVNHREFILRYARQHNGRFSTQKLRAHFTAHKRKESSVGGAVDHLLKNQLIKALGQGEYVLVGKAKPPTKKAPAKKAPAEKVLNGAATETVKTETANGNS